MLAVRPDVIDMSLDQSHLNCIGYGFPEIVGSLCVLSKSSLSDVIEVLKVALRVKNGEGATPLLKSFAKFKEQDASFGVPWQMLKPALFSSDVFTSAYQMRRDPIIDPPPRDHVLYLIHETLSEFPSKIGSRACYSVRLHTGSYLAYRSITRLLISDLKLNEPSKLKDNTLLINTRHQQALMYLFSQFDDVDSLQQVFQEKSPEQLEFFIRDNDYLCPAKLALTVAIQRGHEQTVQCLVENLSAHLEEQFEGIGGTWSELISYAVQYSNASVVDFLISHASTTSAIECALDYDSLLLSALRTSWRFDDDTTAVVAVLLKSGQVNVEKKFNIEGRSEPQSALQLAVERAYIGTAEILVQQGKADWSEVLQVDSDDIPHLLFRYLPRNDLGHPTAIECSICDSRLYKLTVGEFHRPWIESARRQPMPKRPKPKSEDGRSASSGELPAVIKDDAGVNKDADQRLSMSTRSDVIESQTEAVDKPQALP